MRAARHFDGPLHTYIHIARSGTAAAVNHSCAAMSAGDAFHRVRGVASQTYHDAAQKSVRFSALAADPEAVTDSDHDEGSKRVSHSPVSVCVLVSPKTTTQSNNNTNMQSTGFVCLVHVDPASCVVPHPMVFHFTDGSVRLLAPAAPGGHAEVPAQAAHPHWVPCPLRRFDMCTKRVLDPQRNRTPGCRQAHA